MTRADDDFVSAKPFLRWAGGKNWFVKYLPHILRDLEFNVYHEPFLGGGSVYFFLHPESAVLSDINEELIHAYIQVRDNVEDVIAKIESWDVNEESYYKIRSMKALDEATKAARFIFLNRTSFNGIYRVNRKGEYNVPYGKKDSYQFDFDRIRSASRALTGATLKICSFENTLSEIKQNDLVFLDPPYTVSHNHNGFIEYNKKLFSLDDQVLLKEYIEGLIDIGAYFILTNAAHQKIDELFGDCGAKLSLSRFVPLGGKKAKRANVDEFVFTNISNGETDGMA